MCTRHATPTSTLFALHHVRQPQPAAIVELYPGINEMDVEDAIALGARLRGEASSAAA